LIIIMCGFFVVFDTKLLGAVLGLIN